MTNLPKAMSSAITASTTKVRKITPLVSQAGERHGAAPASAAEPRMGYPKEVLTPVRLHTLLISALAVVTALAVGLALRSAPPVEPRAARSVTRDLADDAMSTSSPPDVRSVTPVEELATALAGEDDDVVHLLVLSHDDMGGRTQWVQLWARRLADERPVSILHWDEWDGMEYLSMGALSEAGDGVPLRIVSAQVDLADPDLAPVEALLPPEVDLVLVSWGARSDPDEPVPNLRGVDDDLDADLGARVGDSVPVGVLVPDSGAVPDAARSAVLAWSQSAGVAVVEVGKPNRPQEWAEAVDRALR